MTYQGCAITTDITLFQFGKRWVSINPNEVGLNVTIPVGIIGIWNYSVALDGKGYVESKEPIMGWNLFNKLSITMTEEDIERFYKSEHYPIWEVMNS